MRDIKQIRENYLVLEKEDAEQKKLTTLVRAGLFDAKKLPMLRRALKKDASSMTPAEKNLLIDLLDNLMSQVLHSQQVYMKVRSNVSKKEAEELKEAADYLSKFDPRTKPGYNENTDRQIPPVLILRRKAIRIYPDNQKVALYYSQALDQYVTIPFGIEGASGPARLREGITDDYRAHKERIKAISDIENIPSEKRTPDQAAELTKKRYDAKKYYDRIKATSPRFGERTAAAIKAKDTQKITAAGEIQKRAAQRNKDLLAPVAPDWGGVGELLGRAVRAPIQKIGGAIRDRRAMKKIFKEESDIKTRFKVRLEEKRQEQLDEVLGFALKAGSLIARTASAAKKGYDAFKAARAVTKARQMRRAARNARTGRGAAAGALAGALTGSGGSGDDDSPNYAGAAAKSLGSQQAREYQFQGGLAGGKLSAPGTRDTFSATRQGDFRSPADQIKYMNAMIREGVENITVSFNEETVTINNNTAEKVLTVYNSLSEENQNKFVQMLNESSESFKKAVNFALRY
jgi:hypothetical protein